MAMLNDPNDRKGGVSTGFFDFDEVCQKALEAAGDAPADSKQKIIEDLRIRFEYGGQYVAYIDRYEVVGDTRRISRELLRHGSELTDVQGALAGCSPEDRMHVVIDYADPLGDDLEVPHNISNR